MIKYIITILFASLLLSGHGQTLRELLQQAEASYPLLKAKGYEVQASAGQVSYYKSSILPTLDAAYQVNYATHNNITGMAVSYSFVPISGPPSSENVYEGVFGSAAGLLLNWEPFTFGQRKSKIETAQSYREYQQADLSNEIFQHNVRTINAYLDVIMTTELVKVVNKNLERSATNARIARTLTTNGLRPGTDTALFNAEMSRARIELLNYEKLRVSQEVALQELLGGSATYSIDSSFFRMLPVPVVDTSQHAHPVLQLSASQLMISQREKIYLQRTLHPKVSLWGTVYARGSGIRYDGYVDPEDGLSFSRYNYGVGLILSMPLLRFTQVQHLLGAKESIIKAEQEKLNLVRMQLEKQREVADITFTNALAIAHESPSFYRSAEFSFRTLTSRYNAGLINYSDLIQAQYALAKAEADLRRAYIEAWKALLYKAAIEGDINLFLNQLN